MLNEAKQEEKRQIDEQSKQSGARNSIPKIPNIVKNNIKSQTLRRRPPSITQKN